MKNTIIVIFIVALAGVFVGFLISQAPRDNQPPPPVAVSGCGDNVCTQGEKAAKSCPADCGGAAPPAGGGGGKEPPPVNPPPVTQPPVSGPPAITPPSVTPPPVTPPTITPPPIGPVTSLAISSILNLAHGSYLKIAPIPDGVVSDNRHYVIIVKTEGVRPVASVDVTDPAQPFVVQELGFKGWVSDIAIQGRYAYTVDNSSEGFSIIDIGNPANMIIKGKLGIPNREMFGVALKDNYAYVGLIGPASWNDNIRVLNILNPASPTQVGQAAMTYPPGNAANEQYSWARPNRMYIDGSYLYVAAGNTGLDIFDITNPAQPVRLANVPVQSGGAANDVYVKNNIAYVANVEAKLQIVNVANPSAPIVLGTYATDVFDVHGITGWNNYLSIVGYKKVSGVDYNYLKILQINSPSALTQIREYVSTGPRRSAPYDFAIPAPASWNPDMLLVADNGYGLRLFNIGSFSSPANPSLLGGMFTFGEIRDGYVNGNYLFALYNPTNVIAVINISNPENMQLVGYFETDTGFAFLKDNLAGKGSTLYVAGNEKIVAVNASNPSNLSIVSQFPLISKGAKLKVSGNLLVINYIDANGHLRLRFYDIANPLEPVQKSDIQVDDVELKVGGSMEVVGNTLYIHRGEVGGVLYKINFSNPSQPQILGEYITSGINFGDPSFTSGRSYEFAILGNYMYMTRPQQVESGQANPNDIVVLDIANFPNVNIVGYLSVDSPMEGHEVQIINNKLVIVDSQLGNGIFLYSLANPAAPALLARQQVGTYGFHEAYNMNFVSGVGIFFPEIDRISFMPTSPIL